MLETRRAKECQRGIAGAAERAKEGGRVLVESSDTRLGARCREFESPHSDHVKKLCFSIKQFEKQSFFHFEALI